MPGRPRTIPEMVTPILSFRACEESLCEALDGEAGVDAPGRPVGLRPMRFAQGSLVPRDDEMGTGRHGADPYDLKQGVDTRSGPSQSDKDTLQYA
jgi:hypothetical protein